MHRTCGFLSKPLAPPMGLEMGALGPISVDVRHKAAPPGPRRSPPAVGVPWGHAPPVWRPRWPCRRPNEPDSAPGWGGSHGQRLPCAAKWACYATPMQQKPAWVATTLLGTPDPTGPCGELRAALGPL